jgi:hypothetical protein
MLRKLILLGVLFLMMMPGIVMASDPLEGVKDLDAIGLGQPVVMPTCPASGAFITDNGIVKADPIGKAQYQLLITACSKAAGGGSLAGQIIVTTSDGSTLVMDIAVTSPDGGITYQGTFSAPSYNGFSTAVSSGKFLGVYGVGHLDFGTGLNPNTLTPANAPTIHMTGTLVFSN